MPAYLIARGDISDRHRYRQELDVAPPIIKKFRGMVLARSEGPLILEVSEEKRRIVGIQFSALEKAQEFYHSPENQNARNRREDAATGEIIVVDGL